MANIDCGINVNVSGLFDLHKLDAFNTENNNSCSEGIQSIKHTCYLIE